MLTEELLYKDLYKRCLHFLGIRLRSEREVREKVGEWFKKMDYASKVHSGSESQEFEEMKVRVEDKVIAQLYKNKYLDDQRFAEEWVYSRIRNKPRGEAILRMELLQKGIGRDVIEEVLLRMLRANSDSEFNQLQEMAMKVGEKYIHRLRGEDDRAFVFKISQTLARKGFDSRTIRSVVDDLVAKRYNKSD